MEQLHLTLLYTPILALIFCVLSLLVVIQRRKADVPFGDGDIAPLRSAVRAHGNFAEYVPLAIILLALLEYSGFNESALNGLFIALILARISHATAMFSIVKSKLYFVTRVFGALTTWLIILGSAILLLARVL